MNKAILISIKPEWVAKILNGEKTIEVRKKFPKDYVGWVYVYCSKGKEPLFYYGYGDKTYSFHTKQKDANDIQYELNGKVVARFWCDKVENVGRWVGNGYGTETITDTVFNLLTCLRDDQIKEYLGNSKTLFAIHISKLEIFDRPRELGEFYKFGFYEYCLKTQNGNYISTIECNEYYKLTKAPQNYCYMEGE